MSKIRKAGLATAVVLVVLALLTVGAPIASADTLTLTLTTSNLAGFPDGTVYATVNLQVVGNDIQVTVTAGPGFGLIGPGQGSGAFGLNVLNRNDLSISGISDPTNFGLIDGTTNMDGFGNFNLAFTGPTGGSGSGGFSFNISRSGGFTSISQLLDGSANPTAVHFTGTNLSGTTVTGFASDGAGSTPEPGSLALLGTGLLTMGGALRRRLRNR